jgi:hypothetical protein
MHGFNRAPRPPGGQEPLDRVIRDGGQRAIVLPHGHVTAHVLQLVQQCVEAVSRFEVIVTRQGDVLRRAVVEVRVEQPPRTLVGVVRITVPASERVGGAVVRGRTTTSRRRITPPVPGSTS